MNNKNNRLKEQLSVLLGEVDKYLSDENIFEVIVNPDGKVFLKTNEGDKKSKYILDEKKRRQVINQIASFSKNVANEVVPLLAAEFFNMRFQGFLPPAAEAPCFNIRKHTSKVLSLDDYVKSNIMTEQQKRIIIEHINNKKNIIVAGATYSGKTTLLNAILSEIAKTKDRIVMIEKEPELICSSENKLSLRATEKISMDMLLKATLRATPDRIIVGEVRGEEALTLLDAWSTGHGGGASTIHANSAKDTITRLEQLVARVLDKNIEYVIGQAVNLIIYIKYLGTTRKITSIAEVMGYDRKNSCYKIREL